MNEIEAPSRFVHPVLVNEIEYEPKMFTALDTAFILFFIVNILYFNRSQIYFGLFCFNLYFLSIYFISVLCNINLFYICFSLVYFIFLFIVAFH